MPLTGHGDRHLYLPLKSMNKTPSDISELITSGAPEEATHIIEITLYIKAKDYKEAERVTNLIHDRLVDISEIVKVN
jgi:hypothetical protein